ncbi:hypothetical protein NECAME_14246, partial [Necator americanus]
MRDICVSIRVDRNELKLKLEMENELAVESEGKQKEKGNEQIRYEKIHIRCQQKQIMQSSLKLHETVETLSIALLVDGLRIDDRTPFFSELYPERLVLCHGGASVLPSHAEVTILKYLGEDSTRECDLRVGIVVPETMQLYYVHTHRFFCALTDFWLQFNELQDQVAKSKRIYVVDGLRSKVALDVDVKCPTSIVLPLNQCSDQLLVLESNGLRLHNAFKPMSHVDDVFQKNCVDKDYGYG